MSRFLIVLPLVIAAGCGGEERASEVQVPPTAPADRSTAHPQLDFEHWARLFPLESFHRTTGRRRFDTTPPDDPLDLWKPQGQIITSPSQLCEVELVRKNYAKSRELGPAVPVDLFLWSVAPVERPYLTKLGGVPHRESRRAWPEKDGRPMTFVAQFCFADSRDIVSAKLPDDVMLIFFANAKSLYEETVHIEFSSIELNSPVTAADCPPPSFRVPRLSGHIYRTSDYPESWDVFEQAGHYACYLFPTTQATKIGRETFFVQGDPREPKHELLCALNSLDPKLYPEGAKWPYIGLETLPDDWREPAEDYGWGKYQMMFGDVGCMYFLIDDDGNVSFEWDCY